MLMFNHPKLQIRGMGSRSILCNPAFFSERFAYSELAFGAPDTFCNACGQTYEHQLKRRQTIHKTLISSGHKAQKSKRATNEKFRKRKESIIRKGDELRRHCHADVYIVLRYNNRYYIDSSTDQSSWRTRHDPLNLRPRLEP